MKKFLLGIVTTLVISFAPLVVLAADPLADFCTKNNNASSSLCTKYSQDKTDSKLSLSARIVSYINVILYATGIASVIMLIYAGFMYTTSAGSSEKTKKAKDIILYSILGLIISVLAFAIVSFVAGQFGVKSSSSSQQNNSQQEESHHI